MNETPSYTPPPYYVTTHNGRPAIATAYPEIVATFRTEANDGLKDAEFVARACNCYADLLNACQKIFRSINWSYPDERLSQQEQSNILCAALDKAEGRTP